MSSISYENACTDCRQLRDEMLRKAFTSSQFSVELVL